MTPRERDDQGRSEETRLDRASAAIFHDFERRAAARARARNQHSLMERRRVRLVESEDYTRVELGHRKTVTDHRKTVTRQALSIGAPRCDQGGGEERRPRAARARAALATTTRRRRRRVVEGRKEWHVYVYVYVYIYIYIHIHTSRRPARRNLS